MTQEQYAFLNASLNGLSAMLLMAAYVAIKRGYIRVHGWLMGTAFVTSAVFLACYLTAHALFPERTTHLKLQPITMVYFAILIPHIILAVGMLPFIFVTFWRAYKRDWVRHRKIARPTFWIWLYVSVTGVIIYWMLYHLFPTMAATGS
ncbi:hypothetical protein BH10PLA1_BH10PLA1_07090 [soil metagenome]